MTLQIISVCILNKAKWRIFCLVTRLISKLPLMP